MREMFLQNGFNDFLSKPIDTVRLNTVLENWIPKEKQLNLTNNNIMKTTKLSTSVFSIEGLDVNKGIYQSGGTIEYYYETLTVFLEDGVEKKEEIRKSLATGNLPLYSTHVHALKGASANIGAVELSQTAYALEMAGRRGDLPFIEANNDNLLIMMDVLMSNIEKILAFRNTANGKIDGSSETEQIKPELIKLQAALNKMDADVINKTIDVLLKISTSNDIKAIIRKIAKDILLVNYDEAGVLIESLLK